MFFGIAKNNTQQVKVQEKLAKQEKQENKSIKDFYNGLNEEELEVVEEANKEFTKYFKIMVDRNYYH